MVMLEIPDWVPKKMVTVDTLTQRYFELFSEFKDIFVRFALKVATAAAEETPDAARKLSNLVHLQGVNDSLMKISKSKANDVNLSKKSILLAGIICNSFDDTIRQRYFSNSFISELSFSNSLSSM